MSENREIIGGGIVGLIGAIIAVAILLGIAIAIAPLLFGSKAEEAYHQITYQLSTGERIKLERGKYNKGFFESAGSSVATVIWDVPNQQNSTVKKAEPVSFKINLKRIHYGKQLISLL